jgi:hypothetical protein
MNNDEIKTFEKLTGIAELRKKARRNFHLWTPEQSDRIVFLIELVNREMNLYLSDERQKAQKEKSAVARMKTFQAAKLDAEPLDLSEILKIEKTD